MKRPFKPPDPGRLKHKISLYTGYENSDTALDPAPEQHLTDCWALPLHPNASEKLPAEHLEQQDHLSFVIRYCAAWVETEDQITLQFQGRLWHLEQWIDPDFTQCWMVLQARSIAGD